MGILSDVLTSYRADVSDHVAGLKKLKGAEADRAKETIAAHEKIKSSLEDQIKSIEKVSAIAAGVAGAFTAAQSALNSYSEHVKLSAAASGVSIDALAKATKGLKTEHELLTDAAALNNGAIKLTTQQMVIAEQAMIQYTRSGADNAKVHDAILNAVTSLKTDGLKDLGIFIDTTGLSMAKEADRGVVLERVFGELTKASSAFANSNLTDTEKIEANANRITNAIDKLKVNAGKGVSAGIGAVEWIAQQYGKHISGGSVEFLEGLGAPRMSDIGTDWASLAYDLRNKSNAPPAQVEIEMPAESMARQRGNGAAQAAMTAAQALARFANASTDGAYGGASGSYGGLGAAAGAGAGVFGDDVTRRLALEAQRREWAKKALEEQEEKDPKKRFWKGLDLTAENAKEKRGEKASFMESTFGPIGQFDAYKAAWEGFTGAVTAGYSAMVDGTMSFSKAFKMSVAGALKATGAQMLIESLKEAAYGVAALATPGGQVAALGHFKSSAMFLAGSVAAGVAANALGGGGPAAGAAGGAGAGGGAPGRAPANSNDTPGQSVVYVVGDPFDTETNPRRRQNNAKKLMANLSPSTMGGSY